MNVQHTTLATRGKLVARSAHATKTPVANRPRDVDYADARRVSTVRPAPLVAVRQKLFVEMFRNFSDNIKNIYKKLSGMDKFPLMSSGFGVCLGANFGYIVSLQIVMQLSLDAV